MGIQIGVPNGDFGVICGSGWGLNASALCVHNRIDSNGFYRGEPAHQVEAAIQIKGLVIVPGSDLFIGINKQPYLAKVVQVWQGLLRPAVCPVQEMLEEVITFFERGSLIFVP